MPQRHPEILEAIRRALREDIGSGDATSESIIPADATMRAHIIAKQTGVLAGLDVAAAVFAAVDAHIQFTPQFDEGAAVQPQDVVATLNGSARALLTAERTALNFLGRMSGIATLTRAFVEAVSGTRAVILDTRKTAPGLRAVDKLAVLRGGGKNHRMGLYDMILIKDNHIDFAGSITQAVQRARNYRPDLPIQVECRTLDHVHEALALGVERILLDNMTLDQLRAAVSLTNGRAQLEASGNVTLQTVRAIAQTGVDFISSGALTHSPKVFDVSMDYLSDE